MSWPSTTIWCPVIILYITSYKWLFYMENEIRWWSSVQVTLLHTSWRIEATTAGRSYRKKTLWFSFVSVHVMHLNIQSMFCPGSVIQFDQSESVWHFTEAACIWVPPKTVWECVNDILSYCYTHLESLRRQKTDHNTVILKHRGQLLLRQS